MATKYILKFSQLKTFFFTIVLASISLSACVKVNKELGLNLIDNSEQFDLFVAELPISDIEHKIPQNLSGFNSRRMCVGSIKDDLYNLTTRSCAVTLVPVNKNIDFGESPVFKEFYLTAESDSCSVADLRESDILQNINVYELTKAIKKDNYEINTTSISHSSNQISVLPPICSGDKKDLKIYFNKNFGEKYMKIKQTDLEGSIEDYLKKFPGIYLTVDAPSEVGGRFNLFKLGMKYERGNGGKYYITNNYAKLSFDAHFNGKEVKDTSVLFYLGPAKIYDLDSLISKGGELPQFCLNVCSQSTGALLGDATDKVYIEGGGGVKPVIKAEGLRTLVKEEIKSHGDVDKAVIVKAKIVLPFTFPANYLDMYRFPEYLSPSCRISKEGGKYIFGSIADASLNSENQGIINRSLCQYNPDIAFHLQSLLKLKDDTKLENYDLWMMIMSTEINPGKKRDPRQEELMKRLAYQSYYNNLYGGGYGAYGGGGYAYDGYGYNNYYAMQSLLSSGGGSEKPTKVVAMDKDRFYRAVLHGPTSANSNKPYLSITYALPKR